jgi:hypothetical protein
MLVFRFSALTVQSACKGRNSVLHWSMHTLTTAFREFPVRRYEAPLLIFTPYSLRNDFIGLARAALML